MSGKQLYQQEEQIRRYLQDQMTESERHAFEREMQSDPFLAEAVEGFSDKNTELVFADLKALKSQLKKQRSGSRRYLWYAAASVLLLIVSTLVLINPEENTIPVISENKIQEEVKIRQDANEKPPAILSPEHAGIEKPHQETILTEAEDELIIEDLEPSLSLVADSHAQNSFSSVSQVKMKQKELAQTTKKVVFSKASEINTESSSATQLVTDTSASSPVMIVQKAADRSAGFDQNNQEMDEVVAIGYGKQKKSGLTGAVTAGKPEVVTDRKASPGSGWNNLEEYLKTELLNPSIGSPDEKTIVRLSFTVSENGVKEQFKILKGKDVRYNDEAIRIIKDGPAWLPEIRNGIPEKSEVKIRMVFPAKGK